MSGIARSERCIVISEGERDTTFLEAVVAQHRNGYDVGNPVDIGSEPIDALYRRESGEIAKFRSRRHRDVLLKSEGGRNNIEAVFPRLVGDLSQIDARLALLLDLDGDDLSAVVETLREKLSGRTAGAETRLSATCDPNRFSHFLTQEFTITASGRHVTDFTLVAFRESLESVAGVDKDTDSRETMDDKVERLADDDRVTEPIVRAIF
jgi:hypothetical protein